MAAALPSRDTIGGVVLSGGQGRRMGGMQKADLVLAGRCLGDHAIDRLGAQVDRLALSVHEPTPGLSQFGLPLLSDPEGERAGPLSGVLAGLDWAASLGLSHVVTVAVDTPFFPADLVMRLVRAATLAGTPIALAGTSEEGRLQRHPTFGLWPVSLAADLRAALGQGMRKMVFWADSNGAATAHFADGLFFNINTPEDLARAERMLTPMR